MAHLKQLCSLAQAARGPAAATAAAWFARNCVGKMLKPATMMMKTKAVAVEKNAIWRRECPWVYLDTPKKYVCYVLALPNDVILPR